MLDVVFAAKRKLLLHDHFGKGFEHLLRPLALPFGYCLIFRVGQ
jgi:hypothetical protein